MTTPNDDQLGLGFPSDKPSYHNTTGSEGSDLRRYEAAARGQELAVATWMRRVATATPSEVRKAVLPRAPITSVRRAMTNLTTRGVLEKLSLQRCGPEGRPEHAWRLRQ